MNGKERIKQYAGDFYGNKEIIKIVKTEIFSKDSGYIYEINAYNLGRLLVELGGGRKFKEQEINYDVGIIIKVKINDYVNQNDLLFEVYSNGKLEAKIKEEILDCLTFNNKKRRNVKIVYKIIN